MLNDVATENVNDPVAAVVYIPRASSWSTSPPPLRCNANRVANLCVIRKHRPQLLNRHGWSLCYLTISRNERASSALVILPPLGTSFCKNILCSRISGGISETLLFQVACHQLISLFLVARFLRGFRPSGIQSISGRITAGLFISKMNQAYVVTPAPFFSAPAL